MADEDYSAPLPEESIWESGIYCIKKTDYVAGGVDGVSNRQAKQLANRTVYLKTAIADVISGENTRFSEVSSNINAAQETADNALLIAKQGVSDAANAQTDADTAKGLGTKGIEDAAKAQATADAASELATTAKTKADRSLEVAENATLLGNNGILNAAAAQKTADAAMPMAGGTFTGAVVEEAGWDDLSGDAVTQYQGRMATSDRWRLAAGATGNNYGFVELATSITGDEAIYARQYTGDFETIKNSAVLLDRMGNTVFPGIVKAAGFEGKSVNAGNADVSTRLGTEAVGDGQTIIFLNDGYPEESTETVGSYRRPVYLSMGKIVSCTGSVGNGKTPVYMADGAITQSTDNIASDSKLMYMKNGVLTESAANIGTEVHPVFVEEGEVKPLPESVTVGSIEQPVYIRKGVITSCGGLWDRITSSSYGENNFYIQYASGLCMQCITVNVPDILIQADNYRTLKCQYKIKLSRYLFGFATVAGDPSIIPSGITDAGSTECMVCLENTTDMDKQTKFDVSFFIWGIV